MRWNRSLPWLAAVLLWLAVAAAAGAHGAMIGAYATLTPSRPVPGQPVQLDLEVVDPLNNPMTGLAVYAEVVLAGQKPRVPGQPLAEASPGKYRGSLTFPAEGNYGIALTATAQGQNWVAEVPVIVGAKGMPVTGAGVALEPDDEHGAQAQKQGFPWLWLGAGTAVLLFAVALWVALRPVPPQAGEGP